MLKNFLQGKFLRHPLHPFLVHIPIGLLILSFIFDLASLIDRTNSVLGSAAYYTILGGVGVAVLAAIPGLVDWIDIRRDHPAKKTATLHMILNLTLLGLYGVNAFIRSSALDTAPPPAVPVILSLVGMGLLTVSGYLGGQLVYAHGLAVGQHHRLTATPAETIRVSASDTSTANGQRFVPVTSVKDMKEGETLRVEVEGAVVTIAKSKGKFFAFQEFCTHLYGPLSEGAVQDGQIQCPWHGSCFDLQTGQVTRGPAEVKLKTYVVRVENDLISIQVPTDGTTPAAEMNPQLREALQRKQ